MRPEQAMSDPEFKNNNSDLLRYISKNSPNSPAIFSPFHEVHIYVNIRTDMEEIAFCLNSIGVQRKNNAAIVMENGCEMASAFPSTTSCATCAPLNPNYTSGEIDIYLSDLDIKAVILKKGEELHARKMAVFLQIPIIDFQLIEENTANLSKIGGDPLEKPANIE